MKGERHGPQPLGSRAALAGSRDRTARDEDGELRRPPILIGSTDHRRLQRLALDALLLQPRVAGPLLAEVDRAAVVADRALPPDAVRLGSWVTYAAGVEDDPQRVKLLCAARAGDPATLPVLTSMGAALIGLSVGQSILWADHLGGNLWVTVMDVDHTLARPR